SVGLSWRIREWLGLLVAAPVVVLASAELAANLPCGPAGGVDVGVDRSGADRPDGLGEGTGLYSLAVGADDVGGRDRALDGAARRRTRGLAPAAAEEGDDASAHVLLGEVQMRHRGRILEGVGQLVGDLLPALVDAGAELPPADGRDRARPDHLVVTVEARLRDAVVVVLGERVGPAAQRHDQREQKPTIEPSLAHTLPSSSSFPMSYARRAYPVSRSRLL